MFRREDAERRSHLQMCDYNMRVQKRSPNILLGYNVLCTVLLVFGDLL